MKQKYEELEKKFRNLEQAVINLLNNIKCNNKIKSMVIDVCKALEISDDMTKEIIKSAIYNISITIIITCSPTSFFPPISLFCAIFNGK